MTKEECLKAISNVFSAQIDLHGRAWNIQVQSDPPREIILSNDFVDTYIGNDSVSQERFEEVLMSIPESQWSKENSDTLHISSFVLMQYLIG